MYITVAALHSPLVDTQEVTPFYREITRLLKTENEK